MSSSPDRELQLLPLKGVPKSSDIFAPNDGPLLLRHLIAFDGWIAGYMSLYPMLNRKVYGSQKLESEDFQFIDVKPPHRLFVSLTFARIMVAPLSTQWA